MDAVLWTASLHVEWQPILTFPMKKLGLSDWFEKHVDVVGFTDGEDHLGVAVDDVRSRIVVGRD